MSAGACSAPSPGGFALALVLGNPGSEDKEVDMQTLETPALPRVWRDHMNLKEFLEECKCEICSGTACDTDLDRNNCLDRMGAFFKQRADVYCIMYLGDGCESNGSWVLAEDFEGKAETITLADIVESWVRRHADGPSKLYIYSDSCYSGHLVAQAKRYEEERKPWCSRVFVQASCASNEKAMDGRFTPMWIEAHRRLPDVPFTDSDMGVFLQGGDTTQTPTYYAHKPHSPFLVGSVKIQLLQGKNGDAGDNKQCWEIIRNGLDKDLQAAVDDFAKKPGWASNPKFLALVEDLRSLAQTEPRRGGHSEVDYEDLVDFFKEKFADATLQLEDLVNQFKTEFL